MTAIDVLTVSCIAVCILGSDATLGAAVDWLAARHERRAAAARARR